MNSQLLWETLQPFLGILQNCDAIREPDPRRQQRAREQMEALGKARGRPLIYPMVPSGRGCGPYVELIDGSVKLDLITGIGVHLFGHGHPQLVLEGIKAAMKATPMQGTLMPGEEQAQLLELLLRHASRVPHLGPESQAELSAGWITTCGTMANELALKIVRQKKYPAYKIISFKNTFAGRSTAMQELTDEPKYREGQPTFDQVRHIDFYTPQKSLEENIEITYRAIEDCLRAEPGKFAAFEFELIQGEGGGFRGAPAEWWRAILRFAREQGLALWFDEIQTFGRTGELFAFQRLGLGEFVDVVTCAKPLQAAAVLWREDYQPRPGLIAGTFGGATVPLALGVKMIEMLVQGGYFGPEGRIQKMERFIREDWERRRARWGTEKMPGEARIFGGMIALPILDGKAETLKKLLNRYFEKGVVAFSAGRDPVCLRFLPPCGVFKEAHWLQAMEILEGILEEGV